MKAFIAGGSGYVGRYLTAELIKDDFEVTIIGSSPQLKGRFPGRVRYLSANTSIRGPWQDHVAEADVIVNLTGRSIFHLWTKKYKRQIYNSRIKTTRNLVEGISNDKQVTLVSTSAIGYYGERGDDILTEDDENGSDFLAEVCRDWETEAYLAESKGAKVVIARFGVVIGGKGGALGIMLLPYRFFVGGPMGTGKQWFSWIHIDDLVSALMLTIKRKNMKGVFNMCAPAPLRNIDMAKTIGTAMKRPSVVKVPAFMLKLILGEYGSTLLQSQRGLPDNLQRQGFQFKYPNFKHAIDAILRK